MAKQAKEKDEDLSKLTDRERTFCRWLVKGLSGTKAAIKAGYAEGSAHVAASRLIKKDKVSAFLKQLRQERDEEAAVEAADVLRGLKQNANSDIGELWDADGQPIPIHKLPPEVRQCIASLEWVCIEPERKIVADDGERVIPAKWVPKVKFWNKNEALSLLGKHKKLFTEKVEHSGAVSIAVVDPYAEEPKPEGDEE